MSGRPLRIAINGFGRIGRSVLRLLLRDRRDIEIALINDIADLETCAYLFEFDSVYGPWAEPVSFEDQLLIVGGASIPFRNAPDISKLDLRGIDVVLECTGHAKSQVVAQRGITAGAKRVLISGPSAAADVTLVLGANEEAFRGQAVISNASCTTNALAPLLRVVDREFGIIGGQMTTVHCYTASQPTIDQPRSELSRSRAAALSMVPTTTSAHAIVGDVLPHLAGLIEARALRVPTASVSAIDLTVAVRNVSDLDTMRARLKHVAQGSPVLGWIEKPLVSVDLRGRPESLVLSGPEISLSAGGLLRVFGWYDNEWGFSNRMIDMAQYIGRAN
ncbi:type I glyceraldehyde-3-phosphate dehydrogenase [Rhizobium tropici]|uniref:Aldehyde dehydrogenase n=1 Tax=Rhizobium tropici TaxID=398 RepID=A0A329Y8E9_RHITR|nr:glyceraldehyde 3-phosphate dehydrogenase NAD-binding domain-containing protein [Rhizobium tropici]RAX38234.1 aldehyde dehydrogenase [Rhizobium tropici]